MSSDLARVREYLLAGRLRAMAPVRTGSTYGSECSARRIGTIPHGDTKFSVYGYEYEGVKFVAATDAPIGDSAFFVMINTTFPWAHRIVGFDEACVYSVPSDSIVPQATNDVDRASKGSWSKVSGAFFLDANSEMRRIDQDQALLTRSTQAAVVCRSKRSLTRLAIGPWNRTLAILPSFEPAGAEARPYQVLSVGSAGVAIYDSSVDAWKSVGSPPLSHAKVDVLVPIDGGRVLAIFYKFDSGSDGGFDWDDEQVLPWIFDPNNSDWSECNSEGRQAWKQRKQRYQRMPVRVAITLADGRVLSCEGGNRYVFDPHDVDGGAQAGPRLNEEESLVPALFAQPNGDALIVTKVKSIREGNTSSRTCILLWCAETGFLHEIAGLDGDSDGFVVRFGPDLYARLGGVERIPSNLLPGQAVHTRGHTFTVVEDLGGVYVTLDRGGRVYRVLRKALLTRDAAPKVLLFFAPGRGSEERAGPPLPVPLEDPYAVCFDDGAILVSSKTSLFIYEV